MAHSGDAVRPPLLAPKPPGTPAGIPRVDVLTRGDNAVDRIQDIVAKDTGSVTDDDPPRKVLDALTGEARTDSPTVLPWGVGLTLDTTEWCRDTSNGPVEWDGPRGVYDLGSYKYYIVTRKHIYDARGGLYKIGPEVATDYVTATVGCPTPP